MGIQYASSLIFRLKLFPRIPSADSVDFFRRTSALAWPSNRAYLPNIFMHSRSLDKLPDLLGVQGGT